MLHRELAIVSSVQAKPPSVKDGPEGKMNSALARSFTIARKEPERSPTLDAKRLGGLLPP